LFPPVEDAAVVDVAGGVLRTRDADVLVVGAEDFDRLARPM
jgi:hypothetical protein